MLGSLALSSWTCFATSHSAAKRCFSREPFKRSKQRRFDPLCERFNLWHALIAQRVDAAWGNAINGNIIPLSSLLAPQQNLQPVPWPSLALENPQWMKHVFIFQCACTLVTTVHLTPQLQTVSGSSGPVLKTTTQSASPQGKAAV